MDYETKGYDIMMIRSIRTFAMNAAELRLHVNTTKYER